MIKLFRPFKSGIFTKLYLAQTISLLGDAFTWVGIALLAYQFGGSHSSKILSIALTLRVTAFIIFAPYAGVLADRINRKKILYITHFSRMIIVGLMAFVTSVWQIYVLIFLLNIFNSFFTPAYRASIPNSIPNKKDYGTGVAISNATWQLLGVLGPGLAGAIAGVLGARQIFFFDAASFILAAVVILTIPAISLAVKSEELDKKAATKSYKEIMVGTKLMFKNMPIRFALFIEFLAAIAGAQILVNTVGHVKGGLHLTDTYYGWVMTAFGIGATIAALTSSTIDKSKRKYRILIFGASLLGLSILLANYVSYYPLLLMWLFAGLGQSYAEMPSQILIAENIHIAQQGKVYGAHFAWSHLWWAIAYPIAGITGLYFANISFLIGGIATLILLILLLSFHFYFNSRTQKKQFK